MAETVLNGFRGVVTQVDQIHSPQGALAAADNCAIERDGVVQPRRGTVSLAKHSSFRAMLRGWEFQGQKMLHMDDGFGSRKLATVVGSTIVPMAEEMEDPDTDYRLHQCEAGEALFVAEQAGIRRYEQYNATSGFAGVPKMPDMDRAACALAAGATILDKGQRAYRAYLEVRPLGAPYRTGAPSGRLVLRNSTGAPADATVRVLLPVATNTPDTKLSVGDTWLVLVASDTSDSIGVDPGDDMRVVYDYLLTAADVAAGHVDIKDVTPYSLAGSAAYFNATQEGILGANEPPPFARCIGRYRGCLVAANIITRQRLELNILAVGGANGIQDGDTLTFQQGVSSFTITATTAPSASSDYKLESTGTASIDIQLTAQNICAAINRHASNTICYAHYEGIPGDPQTLGRIVIEARSASASDSAIFGWVGAGNKTICYEPQLTQGNVAGAVYSSSDTHGNGWALSKPDQPDAWPLTNYGRMGAGNIIWIASLEDACFFFHDSGEVWVMSGDPPVGGDPGTLRIERRWTDLHLLCPFSVQEMDGRLLMLSDRGVVAMTPGGFGVISGDIDDALRTAIYNAGPGNVRQKSWAVVQPSERRYVLAIYTGTGWSQFVLNGRTGAWTTCGTGFSTTLSAGFFSSTEDLLYYGDTVPSGNVTLWAERNGVASSSYVDDNAIGPYTSTVTTPPVVVGDGTRPKQLREVQLAFEGEQPPSVTVQVTTEYDTQSVAVASQGTNLLRVAVPRTVQRGVRHTITLTISNNGVKWRLSSIKLLHRPYGERGNK